MTFDLQANTSMAVVEQILKSALTDGDHLMSGAAGLGNLTVDPNSIHFIGESNLLLSHYQKNNVLIAGYNFGYKDLIYIFDVKQVYARHTFATSKTQM